MADRQHPFSMLPPNFNPALGSAAHLPQQQPQQHQSMDHSAAWQQQQLHLRQQQSQQQQQQQLGHQTFPSQPGADSLAVPQMNVNPQMLEYIRNARLQGQQQAFGVANNGINANGQNLGMHDMQANHHVQAGLQQNVNNMGSLGNAATLQAAFQNRVNPSVSRQLELLGMAHNQQPQQPQNGPISLNERLAAQQNHANGQFAQPGMNPSALFSQPNGLGANGAENMLASAAHRQPQPGMGGVPMQQGHDAQHGGLPVAHPQQPNGNQILQRFGQLKAALEQIENEIQRLGNSRASMPEANFNANMAQLTGRRDQLRLAFRSAIAAVQQQQAMRQAAGMAQPNPAANTAAPRASPVLPQNGQTPPNWNQPTQQGFLPGQPRQGTPQFPNMTLQNGIQSSPPHVAAPPNHIPGQSQHQAPPGGLGRQMEQASPPMPPQGQQQGAAGANFPPVVDAIKFNAVYTNFCRQHGINRDERMLVVDGRKIELYDLHREVMAEGGHEQVSNRELWPVIGARIGFISFPGSASEPAKCGPQTAQMLKHVYSIYVARFEEYYIRSWMGWRQQATRPPGAGDGQGLPMPQGNGGRIKPTPEQLDLMLRHANSSVDQMQKAGLPPQMIDGIERNRAQLQNTLALRNGFHDNIRQFAGQQQPPVNPPAPGAVPQVPRGPPQPAQLPGVQAPVTDVGAQPGNRPPGLGPLPPSQPVRPTGDQLERAMKIVAQLKQRISASFNPSALPLQMIPDEQRMEYNASIENLSRLVKEMDSKLALFAVLVPNHLQITRLITIGINAEFQRRLLSSATPKYFMNLDQVKLMTAQMHQAQEFVHTGLRNNQQQNPQSILGRPGPPPPPNAPQHMPQGSVPTAHAQIPQPPIVQPTPPTGPHPPTMPVNRPMPISQPPDPRRLSITNGTVAVSTPTPPATTPAASASTPTASASSPQMPQTPKSKAKPKPKPAPKTKPAPPLKSSPAASGAVQDGAAAPATPADAASPRGGPKRPREDDTGKDAPAVSSQPIKKPKTELPWQGPPNANLVKRQEDGDAVKTDDDAVQYLAGIEEYFKKVAGEGQESQIIDMAETLDQILKGYGTSNGAGASSSALLDTALASSASAAASAPVDDFIEFFDFSSYNSRGPEDDQTVAPTPDLVHSSSTNPSPASDETHGPRSVANTPVIKPAVVVADAGLKVEESEVLDSLRLGAWGEIDGGESAYFSGIEPWKWEGPMAEQSWAMS